MSTIHRNDSSSRQHRPKTNNKILVITTRSRLLRFIAAVAVVVVLDEALQQDFQSEAYRARTVRVHEHALVEQLPSLKKVTARRTEGHGGGI